MRGQHLSNLLQRLGHAAVALATWEFHTINGKGIVRISVEPGGHSVFDKKTKPPAFYWRFS